MPESGATAFPFDLLRVRNGCAQSDRNVVREVVAADGDDGRVPEAAAFMDCDVGGAAADIDQGDAKLLLVSVRTDSLAASCSTTVRRR
jgi:hypothetical protein